jgi:hypothetical protein
MRSTSSAALWSAGAFVAVAAVLFASSRPGLAADDVAAGQALYQGKCTG